MKQIAFIFPGQGAQYVGMGKDFYDEFSICREVIDLASEVTGLDIPQICFTENDMLPVTEYTQIAMLSVEAAITRLLEAHGITSKVNAGLSLGEYAALVASHVISLEDAFSLIRKRGIYMQEAVPTGGAMSAVLGVEASIIEECCELIRREHKKLVSIANYNCPGQIVITGEEEGVTLCSAALKERGAKRIIPLKVSGPFHSKMLQKASEQLEEALEPIEILSFTTPYVSNVTANLVKDRKQVKELLTQQVCSSVRWQQSIEYMIEMGITTFVEIGPGRTLSGFMKKINRDVTVYNIQNVNDFKEVSNAIK